MRVVNLLPCRRLKFSHLLKTCAFNPSCVLSINFGRSLSKTDQMISMGLRSGLRAGCIDSNSSFLVYVLQWVLFHVQQRNFINHFRCGAIWNILQCRSSNIHFRTVVIEVSAKRAISANLWWPSFRSDTILAFWASVRYFCLFGFAKQSIILRNVMLSYVRRQSNRRCNVNGFKTDNQV